MKKSLINYKVKKISVFVARQDTLIINNIFMLETKNQKDEASCPWCYRQKLAQSW